MFLLDGVRILYWRKGVDISLVSKHRPLGHLESWAQFEGGCSDIPLWGYNVEIGEQKHNQAKPKIKNQKARKQFSD